MNLEEEFKKEQEEVKEKTNSNDISRLLSSMSQEQLSQVIATLTNSPQNTENKEEVKEISKDYKDNFVLPKEEVQENVGYDFDKAKEESYEKFNKESTDFSKLYDDAYNSLNEELDLGIKYRGKIVDVKVEYTNYDSILINYEVEDNETIRHVTDTYTFGGEHDKWAMNRLVVFLTSIDGFYKDDIKAYNIEDMANQMKFLIGANVVLAQYQNEKGYRRNQVSVIGTFDRFNRRMVDR